MRILFGTDLFYQNTAGSSNFIKQLSKGLAEAGHEVFMIAPSKKFKNTITKEDYIRVYGIRSIVIPEAIYPSKFRIPITGGFNKIKSIIKEVNPDVIHIQDHFMIGSKIAKEGRQLKIPIIGTNHFMPENFIHYLYPPEFAKKLVKKLAWRAFIRVYKHLDLITVPTKTAAIQLKSLGLQNPIIPISCGVDLRRFNPKNTGAHLRKRYKIPTSTPVVLFVGRLDKEKHIDVLINAFSKIPTSVGAKLVITGKGTERLKLAKLTKKLRVEKEVIFTGFIPDKDLPSLYRIANLFAIASIAELQSIATLEAMASGLPVVAANVMALPELVYNGKNGYLFENGNINDLAGKMIQILKDPNLAKKMSGMSIKIISQHNINQTIKKYKEIYNRFGKT